MKILNLYAGIGGNRKLWGDHDITAIEYKQEIADIYHDFFPKDKVIVGDAHKYLLDHFEEFDFIWASPPCPSHSRIRNEAGLGAKGVKPCYPDMKLYQEIIFLQHQFKMNTNKFRGKYVVENVIPYYKPLIPAQELNRHLFWTNFLIVPVQFDVEQHENIMYITGKEKVFDVDVSKYQIRDKQKILKNMVNLLLGKHILDCAMGVHPQQILL